MCGILGYIGSKSLNKSIISNSLKLMENRGPDNQSYKRINIFNKNIYFFHSRLSIIDLKSRSNQPFKYQNLFMIFNGEIYNYLELKTDLKKKGYRFKTTSDTEVLLKCYYEYGDLAFSKFNGMWSLAIIDVNKGYLKLSRDCFGEKPLYLFHKDGEIIFGSEIKYIKSLLNTNPDLNFRLIKKNLYFGFKSLNFDNKTFFKGIEKVSKGKIYKFHLNKIKLTKKKYYNINNTINLKNFSKIEIDKKFEEILFNAINLRLRSDVPLGFCLSGGIDSSLLVAISKQILGKNLQTFSIVDIDDRYNELPNINRITRFLKCDNQVIKLKKKNFLENITDLSFHHDSPIATISYYVHNLLSKFMASKGIKVSISGTGADELFTGYYHHFLIYLNSIKNNKNYNSETFIWKKNYSKIIRDKNLKNLNLFKSKYLNDNIMFESKRLNYFFKDSLEKKITEKKYYIDKLKNRLQNELLHEIVPVILQHDDSNSMSNSIENRSPYLDKNLLAFARGLDSSWLINSSFQKKILRDFGKKYLPKSIYNDKQKVGFNASIESLIDINGRELNDFLFSDKKSFLYELCDIGELKKLLKMKNLPNYLSKFLFSIISTKAFLSKNNY